jgi:hypothetical protein
MDPLTKNKIQMFGAWCAIAYVVLILIGWGGIAGFLPPTAPSAGPGDIAALYVSDFTRVRIGMIVTMFAALALIPFAAVMAQFIARVEGGPGVLTYSVLLGGAGTMVLTFYPAVWWLVAVYRPQRSGDLIHLVNDMAWLQFIGGVSMYLAMPISMVIAAFCDKSPTPVYPRWSGYATIWIMLTMLPDQLLFFFHRGPFAWNGLFGFWIPLVVFAAFFVINTIVLRRAVLRDRARILEPNGVNTQMAGVRR